MKKILTAGLIGLALTTSSIAGENDSSKLKIEFEPLANVTVHGMKDLYDNGNMNNLDTWFGRLAVGGSVQLGKSTVDAEVHFYPKGFGEILNADEIDSVDDWVYYDKVVWHQSGTGLGGAFDTIPDSTYLGKKIVISSDAKKYALESAQIERALYSYEGMFNLSFGRSFTSSTEGLVFGNYIDQAPVDNIFLGKGIYADFLQVGKEIGITNTEIMLEATSLNLNSGNLRGTFGIAPAEMLNFMVGYKSNMFDLFNDGDADVVHTVSLNSTVSLKEKMVFFLETALKDLNADLDLYVPVLVGARVNFDKVFKYVQIEAEAMKTTDREAVTGIEDSPLLLAITSAVEFNKYLQLSAGVNTLNDFKKPSIVLELTGGLF
jgi:hypothetical protein